MERFILRQNIAIFQRALARETDAAERRIVRQMLAEAVAELARLDALADDPPGLDGGWPVDPRWHIMEPGLSRREKTPPAGGRDIITGP